VLDPRTEAGFERNRANGSRSGAVLVGDEGNGTTNLEPLLLYAGRGRQVALSRTAIERLEGHRMRSGPYLGQKMTMVVATALLCTVPIQAWAVGTTPTVVTVDTYAGLGTVPPTGLGVNDAIWDAELGSDETSRLLHEIGVETVRYPGGTYGDMYHWQDHTTEGGFVAPNTDFDTFMRSARRVHAQPIVIANYGTGTAAEAAGWVRYANRIKRYGVKYWEIGNEIYGNGHYGASWEPDNHADKSPAGYANAVVEYAAAMKAVDPSIMIGAVLTTPGNWPDAVVASGDAGPWNQVVLSIAGSSIDFVVIHWYPGGGSPVEALGRPAQAADIGEMLRTQIARYAGPGASRIGIALTEINTSQGMDTQPGALFAADVYPALWASGMFTVSWWNLHDGITAVARFAGQTDYGDAGLLSNASCLPDGSVCEPPVNTPFAAYHALRLVSALADSGDQIIRVTTSNPLVRGHAARHKDGGLSVLLLNEDPDNAQAVTLRYPGFTPAPSGTSIYRYQNGATEITRGHASPTEQTLPPYSLDLIVLRPSVAAPLPPAPGTPIVSRVTDATATVAWTAGQPCVPRRSSYEVYLHDADGSHLAGKTAGTSLGLSGLHAGARYTVTVVARDALGVASWSTAAVSFVMGTPAVSNCAVHFANAGDWGNGYVGSIDITNTGSEPVEGWMLAFTLPRSWESLGGGWNAAWTADGVRVAATNLDWNAAIAPGATVNIGYVGSYTGPNVLPGVFTLNGAVCTTR
jgi:hypothetical protein